MPPSLPAHPSRKHGQRLRAFDHADGRARARAERQVLPEVLEAEAVHPHGLEAELRRKEAALAETAALLVLSKKSQAIWGDSGEK